MFFLTPSTFQYIKHRFDVFNKVTATHKGVLRHASRQVAMVVTPGTPLGVMTVALPTNSTSGRSYPQRLQPARWVSQCVGCSGGWGGIEWVPNQDSGT